VTTKTDTPILAAAPVASTGRRLFSIGLGALVVALAAQVRIPLPFTPVPATLQDLAVLVVGGALGAAAGGAALVTYLVLGLLGAPVFSGGGAGPGWLLGPTGGYLLAFPVAAIAMGAVTARPGLVRAVVGALLGMVIIHAGGVAQLAILTGDFANAVRLGSVPFLGAGLVKVALAGAIVTGIARKFPGLR